MAAPPNLHKSGSQVSLGGDVRLGSKGPQTSPDRKCMILNILTAYCLLGVFGIEHALNP